MSFATSSALQSAIYAHLLADAGVTAEVGAHVYDAVPTGSSPPALYVLIGEEQVRDRSSKDHAGAQHDISVEVVSDAAGFAAAKDAAAAICDALIDAALTLARGHLVGLQFLNAQARRDDDPAARVVALTFRAFVEDS